MYSIKESYKILKNGVFSGLVSAIGMSIVIPAVGLAGHVAKHAGDVDLEGYSLKNRFETAYSFKTPEEHKYYYATPVINGYEAGTSKEYYLASPYATYGTIAAFGLIGALAGGASSAKNIKDEKLIAAMKKAKSR